MISKLERVPLREVWKREDFDFTPWLQDNIEILNDALDLILSSPEREQAAGDFSVDLVAEIESGATAVIENQLEQSNHDHLGKLITYVSAMEAHAAIWIVSDPRPEHVRAISWLNESSSTTFYLVKVEAVRIGESPPAPLFTLIVGPSEEGREVGKTKNNIADRHIFHKRFWRVLFERSNKKTKLFSNVSPSQQNSISAGSGLGGVHFNYVAHKHQVRVELYIDRGKDSEEENQSIFGQLLERKTEIESNFGDGFDWQALEGKRACRNSKTFDIGGYRDEEQWNQIYGTLTDAMVRFEKALNPHIKRINQSGGILSK